jgi:hypothetical protein
LSISPATGEIPQVAIVRTLLSEVKTENGPDLNGFNVRYTSLPTRLRLISRLGSGFPSEGRRVHPANALK